MAQKTHRHHQRLKQTLEKMIYPQPIEKTPEMARETIQLERDI